MVVLISVISKSVKDSKGVSESSFRPLKWIKLNQI